MLTESQPNVKLTFDEKLRKHVWKYFPKKGWTEPPEVTEMVNFRDAYRGPEVETVQSPEVEPEINEHSDDSSSENEESVPPVVCKPTKSISILKNSRPGPSGLGRKRKQN